MANIDELQVGDAVEILDETGQAVALGEIVALAPGSDVAALRVDGHMMDIYRNVSKLRLQPEDAR